MRPVFLTLFGFATLFSASARASQYPERPIRVIAPFAAGASADVAARIITGKMGEILGQQFVVENRTGALGSIGATEFSRSLPDGYTIMYGNNGQITDIAGACDAIGKSPSYNPSTFVPIGRTHEAHFTLIVNADLPIASLSELVAYARANPGKLSFANGQPTAAIAGNMLRSLLGLGITIIPYRGDPQAMADVAGGHVSLSVVGEPVLAPILPTGKIRPIGGVGSKRNPFRPNLPTLAEQGAVEFASLESWGGLFGPEGFPETAAAALNSALKKAMDDPDVIARMRGAGITPRYSPPSEVSKLVANRTNVAEFLRTHSVKIFDECN